MVALGNTAAFDTNEMVEKIAIAYQNMKSIYGQ